MGVRYVFHQWGAHGTRTCDLRWTECIVPRCKHKTIHHPVCKCHMRLYLGLDICPSSIAGLGLFAERPVLRGDVLMVYTGDRFASTRAWHAQTGCTASPYAMRLPTTGEIIDATALRCIASCINESPDRRSANVFCITAALHPQHFGPVDAASGQHTATAHHVRHAGFRTIPAILLEHFQSTQHPWLLAARNIARGEELLLWYQNEDIKAISHSTTAIRANKVSMKWKRAKEKKCHRLPR